MPLRYIQDRRPTSAGVGVFSAAPVHPRPQAHVRRRGCCLCRSGTSTAAGPRAPAWVCFRRSGISSAVGAPSVLMPARCIQGAGAGSPFADRLVRVQDSPRPRVRDGGSRPALTSGDGVRHMPHDGTRARGPRAARGVPATSSHGRLPRGGGAELAPGMDPPASRWRLVVRPWRLSRAGSGLLDRSREVQRQAAGAG